MPRTVALCICIGIALSVAAALTSHGGQSTDPSVVDNRIDWNLVDLPLPVRARIHIRAESLPPFPMADSLLRNPRGWPATRDFGGVICSLRVMAGTDGIRTIRSLADVRRSDWWHSLKYRDHAGRAVGPSYSWNRDGSVSERAWYGRGHDREVFSITTYRRSGEVYMHETSSRIADGPYERIQEFFARDGRLLGFACTLSDSGGARTHLWYWAGEQVNRRDYDTRTIELHRTTLPSSQRRP